MKAAETFQVRDLRDKEFFVVDDVYLNGFAKKCRIYATGTYFVLCRHANTQTQSCFPSVSLIAEKLRISERQVTRALRILETHKIIGIDKRSGQRNLYYLLDKKHWITPDCQSPLTNSHHTPDCQSGQPLTVSPTKYIKRSIRKKDMSPEAGEVLSYLNEKTGRKYRVAPLLEARLKDGATVEDCKRVINTKLNDSFFIQNPQNLNPDTLFRPSNFDKYLNESIPIKKESPKSSQGSGCPRCGAQVPPQDRTAGGCIHCERKAARV